jgi:KDO2-lipid IV(A) lauroyltransferase
MKISHGLEYAGFSLITGLVQAVPASAAGEIAFILGNLAHTVLKSRRRIALENLRRAFGNTKSEPELDRIVHRVFLNVAMTTVEFARQPTLTREKILEMVPEYEGIEHFDRILDEGRGAMLVTGHFGNWELLGAWMAAKGYPTDFIVGRQHNEKVDEKLNSFRSGLGIGLIPVGEAPRRAMRALRGNRFVALVSDQHATSHPVVVDFFGRPAATPRGPAMFAVKVNCPIVSGVLIREKFNRHRAVIYPPFYPPQSGDTEKDVTTLTQQYTSRFEAAIREHPDQWMWTHRRWKINQAGLSDGKS